MTAHDSTPSSTVRGAGGSPAPASPPELQTAVRQFGRVLSLVRPYWGGYLRLAALSALIAGVVLSAPLVTRALVDRVYPSGDISLLHVLVVALVVVHLVRAVLRPLHSYFTTELTAHLQAASSLLFLNHAQHLPDRAIERMPVGDLTSRFRDLSGSLEAVGQLFDLTFLRGLYILSIPPLLLWLDWKLTLVALLTTPLVSLLNVLTARVLRTRVQHTAEASALVDSFKIETLSNLRLFKTFAEEPSVYRRASHEFIELKDTRLSLARVTVFIGLVSGVLKALGTVLYTYVGWRLILAQDLTLGSFMAFNAYLGYLQGPLDQFLSLFTRFQSTAVALHRTFEILDMEVEGDPLQIQEGRDSVGPLRLDQGLALDGASFGYASATELLKRVSVRFERGRISAIVGPSGAGKTTILKLLTRFVEPSEGRVLVGDRDLVLVDRRTLRSAVVAVWQDAKLLRGTLASNLSLGLEIVDPVLSEEVLSVVCLDGFVQALPKGIDTPVAEWGSTLSGGQKQRLALARALVRRPSALLLDEVTSNLDRDTERAMLENMLAFLPNATIVLVSHRASTTTCADTMYQLSDRKLLQVDRHQVEKARDAILTGNQSGDESLGRAS